MNTVELFPEMPKPKPAHRIIPPTVEMVFAYVETREHKIDPNAFIDFYTSIGWKIGKNKMVDWQAAVRTWESREKVKKGNGKHIVPNYKDEEALTRYGKNIGILPSKGESFYQYWQRLCREVEA